MNIFGQKTATGVGSCINDLAKNEYLVTVNTHYMSESVGETGRITGIGKIKYLDVIFNKEGNNEDKIQ